MSALSLSADVVIVGGGMGGVAAALTLAAAGKRVILTEPTRWLGGQMTAQGVSALDEHAHIETFGGTQRYNTLRALIRQHYAQRYRLPAPPLNPGGGWVSRLCFEPRVGVAVLHKMLAPYMHGIRTLYEVEPVGAQVGAGGRVQSVTVSHIHTGAHTQLHAPFFLDASELGDLLPLTQTAYVTGAESQAQTGEALAPTDARPHEMQSFTFTFALDYRPHERHIIAKPRDYARLRDSQPYSFTLTDHRGGHKTYPMFDGDLPFWTYRRILDGALHPTAHDIAMINWHGNDYYSGSLIDVPAQDAAHALNEAKQLALGFLYWLQTEAPRDGGGNGYPELRLRADVMGSADGLSQAPYIRESRRIVPLARVVASQISATDNPPPFAPPMRDSVGVGWYAMDLHACVGNPHADMYAPTLPFQIPLGALVPVHTPNLLPACKNIGTTHLTNGAYRLHPTEWNIGESTAHIALLCLNTGVTPQQLAHDDALTRGLQRALLTDGVPLCWTLDTPPTHPHFIEIQMEHLHA